MLKISLEFVGSNILVRCLKKCLLIYAIQEGPANKVKDMPIASDLLSKYIKTIHPREGMPKNSINTGVIAAGVVTDSNTKHGGNLPVLEDLFNSAGDVLTIIGTRLTAEGDEVLFLLAMAIEEVSKYSNDGILIW